MVNGILAALSSSPSIARPFLPQNPNPRRAIFHRSRWRFGSQLLGSSSPSVRRLRGHFSSTGSMDLPLLPFELSEVLIPSECKTLHLYEARFLALLEESLLKRKKAFVHFVLDPVLMSRSSSRASFAARYGCLVHIESINKLEIGALVTIRGICRVSIVELVQMEEPYLRGVVVPMLDKISYEESESNFRLSELKESIHNLHSLQIKLKTSKEELLQTNIKKSLLWAESEVFEDCSQAFIPKVAERVSFAAFQSVSGMTAAELHTLQREKLQAMDTRDTLERLGNGIEFVKQNINMVAAKLAIQSLQM
ncbi:uncharacterized protein [Typha latifolia]|uniref:uncharacterized protein isoform X1 n=1 Tax=Typha latifolia TaxID=4733 RepID=UPI003C2C5B97